MKRTRDRCGLDRCLHRGGQQRLGRGTVQLLAPNGGRDRPARQDRRHVPDGVAPRSIDQRRGQHVGRDPCGRVRGPRGDQAGGGAGAGGRLQGGDGGRRAGLVGDPHADATHARIERRLERLP